MLPRQAGIFLGVLTDLNGLRSMRQIWLAPLRILALGDLVHVTACRHGLTLHAFEDDPRVDFGVPLAAFHG
jgi:hypothetical protein